MKRRTWILAMVVCVAIVLIVGCVSSVDPATGEELTKLTPKIVSTLDAGADIVEKAVPTATVVASSVWPILTPVFVGIGTLLTTLAGAWKINKPKLVAATSRADKAEAVTVGVINGVESYKAASPETWEKLGDILAKTLGPELSAIVKAIIKRRES